MSVNTNRAKLNKANDSKDYNRLIRLETHDPYWDDDHTWRCKDFPNHKGRSYKTWKHTRKTQWKG